MPGKQTELRAFRDRHALSWEQVRELVREDSVDNVKKWAYGSARTPGPVLYLLRIADGTEVAPTLPTERLARRRKGVRKT